MTTSFGALRAGEQYLVHLAGYRNGNPLVDNDLKEKVQESNRHTFVKGFLDAGSKLLFGSSIVAALSPFFSIESRASILCDKQVCAYFPDATQAISKSLNKVSDFINSFGFSLDLSSFMPDLTQSAARSSWIPSFISDAAPSANETLTKTCAAVLSSDSLLQRVGIRTVNYLARLKENVSDFLFYPQYTYSEGPVRFSTTDPQSNLLKNLDSALVNKVDRLQEYIPFLVLASATGLYLAGLLNFFKRNQMQKDVVKELEAKFDLAAKELDLLSQNTYTPEAKDNLAALASDILYNKQVTLQELDALQMPLQLKTEAKEKLFAKVETVAQQILNDY